MDDDDDGYGDTFLEEVTGHSRHLRHVLRDRRKDLRLSAREVAERASDRLGDGAISTQSIYDWEAFRRHPAIDRYAAWARALGYRLVVDLDDAAEGRHPILVRHEESASAAKTLDAIDDPAKRRAVLATLKALLK